MNSFLAHIRNENGRLIAHALDEHLVRFHDWQPNSPQNSRR
jgi:hypothetical protein